MPAWLWVALGGAVGSVGRYALAVGLARLAGPGFPWGTFAVNVIGSFAMGVLAVVFMQRGVESEPVRYFMMTGILGGFTTFSAFSLDALVLAQRGEMPLAIAYVLGSVVLTLLAVGAGYGLARGVLA